MMNIRPIKTEADYAWALKEVEVYFDHEPEIGSDDGNRFEILTKLIEAYEDDHFPIRQPEPVAFLKSFMEMTGRSQSDLATLLGSRSRASEVLRKRRALTVDMIHKLHTEWRIPSDYLVAPYHLETGRSVAA